jgi:hypothetical protein
MLKNQLLQKRSKEFETRLIKGIAKEKKLKSITEAENELYNKQQQSDLALAANLELQDQLKYSTVTIKVYQSQSTQINLFMDIPTLEKYEPSFGTQLLEKVQLGWNGLIAFILFLVSIWEVILILIIMGLATSKLRKKYVK